MVVVVVLCTNTVSTSVLLAGVHSLMVLHGIVSYQHGGLARLSRPGTLRSPNCAISTTTLSEAH